MTGKGTLIIVESPAKAKTISKILGKEYQVIASVGHVRDLDNSGRGKKALGIDIEDHYKPNYAIIKGKEKVISEIKKAAEKKEMVLLAPDPDREGEAIAWHLRELIDSPPEKIKRITYQAITPSAVREAVSHPRDIDMNLVNAQQGRRILDRLVGFSLSPFLWKKVTKNLSAGRVQSVAVKIVVEKERAIAAFIPQEYWKIVAHLSGEQDPSFVTSLVKWKGEKFGLGVEVASTEASVKPIAEALKRESYRVASIEEKEVKGKPSAPFITSTLQQAASTLLGFSTSRTMRIAQQLYEGIDTGAGHIGLITYMRTDSTRVSPEGIKEAREYIGKNFAPPYLPEKPNYYTAKKGAQDAHEAVRPNSVEYTPESLKSSLSQDQYKLYSLIWKRFIASQMMPALYGITTITVEAGEGIFEAKGRVTKFDGYTRLLSSQGKEKEDDKYQDLPALKEQDQLTLENLESEQHFTKPPSRYSEAGLVRALEKEGVGRPSTYAPIIKTIQDRGYVRIQNRSFHATELGMAVTDILNQNFSNIMDLKFTASMEQNLDSVEEGEKDWVLLLDEFYKPFSQQVETAIENAPTLKNRPYEGELKCPLCGGDFLIRYSKSGAFLGCVNYPECKGLLPMPGEEGEENSEESGEACPSCGSVMVRKQSRYGQPFWACSKYPECKTTISIDAKGNAVKKPEIEKVCDVCGKPMEVKGSRRGYFMACSGYPECKYTLPIDAKGNLVESPDDDHTCPECGGITVVKSGRRGYFIACTNYPKCKHTKPMEKKSSDKEKEGEEK